MECLNYDLIGEICNEIFLKASVTAKSAFLRPYNQTAPQT